MKILQVINSFNMGGAEKLVSEIIPLMKDKGIEVEAMILSSTKSELENQNNFPVQILSNLSIYNPLNILFLFKIVRKYDVIHMHLFPTLYFVTIAKLLSFSKAKLVYTEHNTYNKRRGNIFYKLIDNFIYSKLDKIITISDEVDVNLKKHINNRNIKLIHNGINIKKIVEAVPYSQLDFFNEDSKLLIQVSSFTPQKDHKTLINSVERLPSNFKLLLVGDGPLKEEVISYVKNKQLENRVKFLGIRTDVYNLLKTSDYVILSSAFEGLSLSSLEGMCVGKPFIASEVPGLTSIVKNYGLLFPYQDDKKLAEIVLELDASKNLNELVSNRCFERANQFSLNKTVEKYINIYKSFEM